MQGNKITHQLIFTYIFIEALQQYSVKTIILKHFINIKTDEEKKGIKMKG